MKELKRIVNNISEDEAKSLLFNMLLWIKMAEETDQISDQELAGDLKKVYTDFLAYKKKQEKGCDHPDVQTIHIVFGASIAGSMQMALKKMNRQKSEKVIKLADFFAIGPVWKLHTEEGQLYRQQWLEKHINLDEEDTERLLPEFNRTMNTIAAIDEQTPIVIWLGENPHEQTALRYALFLLKEKANDIYLINTSHLYQRLFSREELVCTIRHSGEIDHHQIAYIYQQVSSMERITQVERKRLINEWETLANHEGLLRIWENERVRNVEQSYYDNGIIETMKDIHSKQSNREFVKAARVIGEVLGNAEHYLDDVYLEYRLRQLIIDRVLEIEGVPNAMRYYSVKLRD
ncbi:DUF1835 domain-containing protein [Gracilibacillus sp. S3-1-1]|uniref:DUF1835 domain-containing protein n=1 Tax=Gracilibacillus pellucidus TaxID=3095368 RepID=A0ACC6M782_9BACI|nr:DUF1835 domain-containing protein [Gracilibacillus sp. S3-1-1]MDX8046672.1 DUF1835 domain-containing protein [Gracilibacillus sp. S3-1-1]